MNSHDRSRIVIVLDEIGLQGEDKASRSRPFHSNIRSAVS